MKPSAMAFSSSSHRERRQRDALKGFTYLESFDELLPFTEDAVDPLQRSNIPLLKRARCHGEAGAKVMLIYDYRGGYNDYEACQGVFVEKEQYSCEFLQSVEVFVYFSHRLVTIPPPTWINTCHRNGGKFWGRSLSSLGRSKWSAYCSRMALDLTGSLEDWPSSHDAMASTGG